MVLEVDELGKIVYGCGAGNFESEEDAGVRPSSVYDQCYWVYSSSLRSREVELNLGSVLESLDRHRLFSDHDIP